MTNEEMTVLLYFKYSWLIKSPPLVVTGRANLGNVFSMIYLSI